MKVLNIFFIFLFIVSAAFQYNDPDPYVWMPIYLYGALICYLALKRKFNIYLYGAGSLVYSVYAFYLIVDETGVLSWLQQHNAENIVQSMKATKPWIEETREFFGLLILIFSFVVNMIWLRKSNINNQPAVTGKIAEKQTYINKPDLKI
jgi:hypothetical protein